jgi:hypothetical protein
VPEPVTERPVEGEAFQAVTPALAIVHVPEPTASVLVVVVLAAWTPLIAPLKVTL